MPNNQGGSDKIMEWIAAHLPPATYVNIMAQYTPLYKAFDFPEISRRITPEEYRAVVEVAENAGLTNLDLQGFWWLRR
jgi:putative pyruvate formate lyase activating enzyme